MKTEIEKIKTIFTENFASLSPRVFDLNEKTLKVIASCEDGEGDFCNPDLIMDCFNSKFNDIEIAKMMEAIEEEWLVFDFKKSGDNYIITAGHEESVYALKLQIFRTF